MFLIYFRSLAWEFSAETVTILLVQVSFDDKMSMDYPINSITEPIFCPSLNDSVSRVLGRCPIQQTCV